MHNAYRHLRIASCHLLCNWWLLITILALFLGTTVYANTTSEFATRYSDLMEQQAMLLYTDETLSTLRQQLMHAQLWYLYNDPVYTYWSHELAIQLQAYQNNPQQTLPAKLQQIANFLTQRQQTVFGNQSAVAWFNAWSQRWETAMRNTMAPLAQEVDQLFRDFPAYAAYVQLNQEATRLARDVFSDTAVAQAVTTASQNFTQTMQALVSGTAYSSVVAQFQQDLIALLATNQTFNELQQRANAVTASLVELRQRIHGIVAFCLQYGFGDACFDSKFNTYLQTVLPAFNVESNRTLEAASSLAQIYVFFWYEFYRSDAFHVLYEAFLNDQADTLAPIDEDLQDEQKQFFQTVKAISEVQSTLGALWDQMADRIAALAQPTAPDAAILIAPSATVTESSPTFEWQAVTGATWYQLWVVDSTSNGVQQWYHASQVACDNDIDICSITPEAVLAPGAGWWWVRTWNDTGYGPWSAGTSFTVSPD